VKIKKGIFIVTLAIFSIANIASANSYTYAFDIPYNKNTSLELFGTNAMMNIKVDNGNTSNVSQTYLLSQITQITLATTGGKVDGIYAPQSSIYDTLDFTDITTTTSGDQASIRFNLNNYWNSAAIFSNQANTYKVLLGSGWYGDVCLFPAQDSNCGGNLYAAYIQTPTYVSKFHLFYYPEYEITGSKVSIQVIPLPATFSLLAAGLIGLSALGVYPRKKQ